MQTCDIRFLDDGRLDVAQRPPDIADFLMTTRP